mgnify:CR=1 FL=1
MAVGWLLFVVWLAWPSIEDYYAVLPDEVEAVDQRIAAEMATVPADETLVPEAYYSEAVDIAFNTTLPTTALPPQELYQQTKAGSVYINTFVLDEFYNFGSGSVIGENGIILTNYHVVEGAEKIAVTFADETTYPVTDMIAVDPEKDIAVLQIDTSDLPALPLGSSAAVAIGDTTYAVGHPENLLFTFSEGIVSGIREFTKTGEGRQFQITNPISAGSSGGALINERGELIGLPVASLEYAQNTVQVQNINFAVPISSVVELLQSAE